MDDDSCCICLNPLVEGLAVTPCGHVFHKACINRCEKRECPICRTSLREAGSVRLLRPHLVCGAIAMPSEPGAFLADDGSSAPVTAQIVEVAVRTERLRKATRKAFEQREATARQMRELEAQILRAQLETMRWNKAHRKGSDGAQLALLSFEADDGQLPASAEERRSLLMTRCNQLLKSKLELKQEQAASAQKQQEEARLRADAAQLEHQLKLAQEELRALEEDT